MDDRHLRERLLAWLLRTNEDRVDPNLIAAYVDLTLPDSLHRFVARRIVADPELLLLVRAIEEEARYARAERRLYRLFGRTPPGDPPEETV